MNSLRKGLSLTIVGALLTLAAPRAWAEDPTWTNDSAAGSANVSLKGSLGPSADLGNGRTGSLLAYDAQFFANPTEVGFEANGALAQITSGDKQFGDGTNGANCNASAGLGVLHADARLGIGYNTEDPRIKTSTDRNGRAHNAANGQFASNAQVRRAKMPPGIECSASASASLAQVKGECAITLGGLDVGTVGAQADGPGAQFECNCTGCDFGAYLVNVEGSYDSPSIGGCGLKASLHVKGSAGVGIKLGAGGASKGVGGRLAVGPFSVDAGVSIDEFDPGAMADCALGALKTVGNLAVDAGKAIGDAAVTTFNAVANTLGDVANGAGNLLSSAGDALHSLCFFCSDDPPKPSAPASIPGTNVARNAITLPMAAIIPGTPNSGMPSVAHGVNRD